MKLTEFGDYLDGIDNVQERNEAGFNRLDKGRWPNARGSWLMGKVLYKYRKQLSGAFDDAEKILEEGLALAKEKDLELPLITLSLVNKQVVVSVDRFLQDKFQDFVSIQKSSGFRWNPDKKAWNKAEISFAGFDIAAYEQLCASKGFALAITKEVIDAQARKVELTAASVSEHLDAGSQVKAAVVRKVRDGWYEIRFPFSAKLNAAFNNKVGSFSGIVQYNPINHARETSNVFLALEAIDKIKQIHPDWKIVVEGIYEDAEASKNAAEKNRLPIQGVVDHLNPELSLFGFQNEAVRFLNEVNGNALLGYSMGTGKTLISLSWLVLNNKRALVVCPKVVRRNWTVEAKKFFPGIYNDFNTLELRPSKTDRGVDLSSHKLVSVNYESLIKFIDPILAAGFDTIIIDESHYAKDEKTARAKLLLEIAPKFKHHILLSGTAIKNKKEELFTQSEMIVPGFFKDKKALKFMTIGETWHSIQSFYRVKTKEEVLKDLPVKASQLVELECKGCPDINLDGKIDFEDIARMKSDVAIAKTKTTISFIEELLAGSDDCAIIFSESVEVTKAIHEHFKDIAILHHGQLSDDVREKAKADFQNPESGKRLFVSTRQSLAVGATLTRASKVIFNDMPWTPADIRQSEDRAHRIGQINPVNVYWVTAQDNRWDQKVNGILFRKYDLSKRILEGKKISPEEREWMEKPLTLNDLKTSEQISLEKKGK